MSWPLQLLSGLPADRTLWAYERVMLWPTVSEASYLWLLPISAFPVLPLRTALAPPHSAIPAV